MRSLGCDSLHHDKCACMATFSVAAIIEAIRRGTPLQKYLLGCRKRQHRCFVLINMEGLLGWMRVIENGKVEIIDKRQTHISHKNISPTHEQIMRTPTIFRCHGEKFRVIDKLLVCAHHLG